MKPFTSHDLFLHRTLQALQGSPAHHRTVFVVSRPMKESDSYEAVAWSLDASTGEAPRPLTSPAFNTQSPALDPHGQRLAFLSKRDGGSLQLQLLRLDGGEARQLTHSERDLQAIQMWSPDGARLLVTAKVPWAEDEDDDTSVTDGRPWVVNFLPYKLDGSGPVVGHRDVLLAVDAQSGDERVLVEGDFDVSSAQWSPDGKSLAFIRARSGTQRHLQDLWIADADGANARQVTHDQASISGIRWSPDGRSIAFGGSRREGDSMVHLCVFDVETCEVSRPAGNELQLEGSHIVWHPDSDRVALVAARRGLHQVVVVDIASGKVARVDSGLRHASGLCVSGDRLVFVSASVRHPEEVYSVTWDGRDERRHSAFNREWFKERARPRVDKRMFKVPDGDGGTEEIDAWVLLPADGDGPFPVLLDFHGGPQSDVLIDYAAHAYWYDLLSHGWAVVAANAVGSGGYGVEFARRMCGYWGELDLPQHLAVIDTLQEEGVVSDRLACTGKSYGGYLAAWAIGHSDRFRAAVISAPVANLESHTGTSDTGYYVGPYSMDGEITQVRERYHDLSPVEHCHGTTAATLLLQGENDERCPLGQAEEIFANLIRCAKATTRMVVYPGGSHKLSGNGKPSHRVDFHRRLAAWVREHS
jgi:dipeptidyl aminopeptidase/acylaminoacyl peptidase